MPRVKRGFKARRRRNKILKRAKGFYGRRKSSYKRGVEAVRRAWAYSYRDRKKRKREFRSLWIQRIQAAVRTQGLSYSQFIHKLKLANIQLNRKSLSEMAIHHPEAFKQVVTKALAA